MKNLEQFESGIHQRLRGRVRVAIVDSRTKRVIKKFPWQNNLILNQGMNNYATTYSSAGWVQAFTYCVAGTGTTPTKDDSGTTQASQSGTAVTLTGGSFTLTNTGTDAGKMIKWDSGAEAMILTVTDSTHCVVTNSATVASGEFTVYRTNQTGLTTEVKRSNTYVAGAGSCETVVSSNTILTHRRTFDFTSEVGSVSYTEIGLSHAATVAANLFSRILLASPVALVATQQLRVLYELAVTWLPSGITSKNADIPGWPVAPATDTHGGETWETVGFCSSVSNSGSANTVDGGGSNFNELLGTSVSLLVHSVSTALPSVPRATTFTMNSGVLFVSGNMSVEAYVANAFTAVKYYTLTTTESNFTTIRSFSIGRQVVSTYYVGFRFLFDLAQTKDSLHKLTVRFRYTWTRVLG